MPRTGLDLKASAHKVCFLNEGRKRERRNGPRLVMTFETTTASDPYVNIVLTFP